MRSPRWPWVVFGGCVALTVAACGYAIATPGRGSEAATLLTYLTNLSFPTVGLLIATRRPGNRIGAILLAVGLIFGVAALSLEYPRYVVTTGHPSTLAIWIAWGLQSWWAPALGLLTVYIPLLFPDGHLLSRRWRVVGWLAAIAIAGIMLASPFIGVGDNVAPFEGVPPNPFHGPFTMGTFVAINTVSSLTLLLVTVPLAMASLVIRFRRSRGDERERMKWFVFGVAVLFVALVIGLVFDFIGHPQVRATILGIGVMAIPIATGFAILRSRLYDIDIVIHKAVVALVLATVLGALGAVVLAVAGRFVLGHDTSQPVVIAVSAFLGAVFVPLLKRARRVADRLVFGQRSTPYEVLTGFSARVAETYATDDVLPRMARLLMDGTGATGARVLVRVGDQDREAASAGESGPNELVVPVAHQGEELGALTVTMPVNDPMTPAKERLVRDIAAQAGPVLSNVRLLEELRASRKRLVAAQDEERRKIERNLHDGVQQQLVALNVQLGLLARIASTDPGKAAEIAAGLQAAATDAIDDLRDLARGIYPPLLADKGLVAALEAQARKAAVPTDVRAEGVGRYPQEVESAVYFCALEGLNNVAKYARATQAAIELAQTDGHLRFTVTDDGAGFDPTRTGYGTGLQGMADRLDAVGGSFEVRSAPGAGTTVQGRVPVPSVAGNGQPPDAEAQASSSRSGPNTAFGT